MTVHEPWDYRAVFVILSFPAVPTNAPNKQRNTVLETEEQGVEILKSKQHALGTHVAHSLISHSHITKKDIQGRKKFSGLDYQTTSDALLQVG